MKNLQYLLILLGLWSCNNSSEERDIRPNEFDFPNRSVLRYPDESYAFAFTEFDTLSLGDTYRAKVFLANRSNVYDGDSLEPLFRYYHKEPKDWDELVNQDALIESINDTAYVKFVVQDKELEKGQAKVKKWYASIRIPLKEGDYIFKLEQEYVVQRK